MTWDGVIPESAWKRNDPAAIVLEMLTQRAHSKEELVAACGTEWRFKQAIAELGDRIERALHQHRAYYRIKPDGKGPQETVRP